MEKIKMRDIEEAMKLVESTKPKCKKCGTGFDKYLGVLGYNCKCGCEKDAKSPAGKDIVARLKRLFC